MSNQNPLFPDDTGELPADVRRLLVNILRGPLLDGQRQAGLWTILLSNEQVIRARLNELFLKLVMDREQKVAFLQQAEVAELDAPALLRRSTLSFKESALVLHLRAELASADVQGERCVVERSDLVEHLKVYTPADENDTVKADRQSEAAIEKLIRLSLLHKLRGSETRMEVSQALRLLFSVEEIDTLTATYEAIKVGGVSFEAAAAVESVDEDAQ